MRIIQIPYRVPNCNAYAERFVGSIREECLEGIILFGSDIGGEQIDTHSTPLDPIVIRQVRFGIRPIYFAFSRKRL